MVCPTHLLDDDGLSCSVKECLFYGYIMVMIASHVSLESASIMFSKVYMLHCPSFTLKGTILRLFHDYDDLSCFVRECINMVALPIICIEG